MSRSSMQKSSFCSSCIGPSVVVPVSMTLNANLEFVLFAVDVNKARRHTTQKRIVNRTLEKQHFYCWGNVLCLVLYSNQYLHIIAPVLKIKSISIRTIHMLLLRRCAPAPTTDRTIDTYQFMQNNFSLPTSSRFAWVSHRVLPFIAVHNRRSNWQLERELTSRVNVERIADGI